MTQPGEARGGMPRTVRASRAKVSRRGTSERGRESGKGTWLRVSKGKLSTRKVWLEQDVAEGGQRLCRASNARRRALNSSARQ